MEEPTFIAVSTLCGILTFFLGGLIYRLVVENFIFMKYVISKVVDNRESKIVIRQGTHWSEEENDNILVIFGWIYD